jgi:hypothetical protein
MGKSLSDPMRMPTIGLVFWLCPSAELLKRFPPFFGRYSRSSRRERSHLNCVTGANRTALDHAAQDATPPPQLIPEAGSDCFELVARLARNRNFQHDFAANLQPLAGPQVSEKNPLGRDVLAYRARGQTKLSEGLALNKQDLAATSDPPVGAALEASICDRPGLRLFEHVPVLGDRYKQSGDFSHG